MFNVPPTRNVQDRVFHQKLCLECVNSCRTMYSTSRELSADTGSGSNRFVRLLETKQSYGLSKSGGQLTIVQGNETSQPGIAPSIAYAKHHARIQFTSYYDINPTCCNVISNTSGSYAESMSVIAKIETAHHGRQAGGGRDITIHGKDTLPAQPGKNNYCTAYFPTQFGGLRSVLN